MLKNFSAVGVVLPIFSIVSGCQSTDDQVVADWSPARLERVEAQPQGARNGSYPAGNIETQPLPKTQVLMGTGRLAGDEKGNKSLNDGNDPDGVTLNLVNTPIAQAAKIVLGEINGSNFIIDPKVDGKITLQTARPTRKKNVIEMFEAALRGSNAALVQAAGGYRIVPLDQAASAGAPLRTGNGQSGSTKIGETIELLQLRYVSAAEMKRVLEPIAPHGAMLRADEARNLLTLSGSPEELASIKETIDVFDIDTMRGMSFAIVPVRSNDPDALADDVRTVFGSDKDGPTNGVIRFIGNKRLQAILVITSQPRYISRADAWIRKLDSRARGGEKQFYTYEVQNRPAKELVAVLDSLLSSDSATGGSRTNAVAPRSQATALSTSATSGATAISGADPMAGVAGNGSPFGGLGGNSAQFASPGSQSSPLENNMASGGAGTASTSLGGDQRIKIAADQAKNALLIIASPEDYKRVLRMIERLDLLPNQVLIEATIAEVTLTDDMQFGVRAFLQQRASKLTNTNDAGGSLASVFPGFSYVLKGMNAQLTLNALNSVTHVNVISTPSLTVLDNKTATLQVGDQVPITTQSAVSVATTGAPVVNSVSYRDTGVILSITPHINESGRVLLDLEQEVSSVAQTTSSNINSPTIQQRKVKTSVVLNDAEALALGGLRQDHRSVSRDQVPLFGDIPLLGAAFRSKDDSATQTELVILITPHVIRSLSEARGVTDEFREKLRHMQPTARLGSKTFEQSFHRILD